METGCVSACTVSLLPATVFPLKAAVSVPSDSVEAGTDSVEAEADSVEAGTDSVEAEADSVETGTDSVEAESGFVAVPVSLAAGLDSVWLMLPCA